MKMMKLLVLFTFCLCMKQVNADPSPFEEFSSFAPERIVDGARCVWQKDTVTTEKYSDGSYAKFQCLCGSWKVTEETMAVPACGNKVQFNIHERRYSIDVTAGCSWDYVDAKETTRSKYDHSTGCPPKPGCMNLYTTTSLVYKKDPTRTKYEILAQTPRPIWANGFCNGSPFADSWRIDTDPPRVGENPGITLLPSTPYIHPAN